MEHASTFEYPPLPSPRCTRLVVLRRGDDDPSCPLTCGIMEMNVDRPAAYLALSYTWNDETPSVPLTVCNVGASTVGGGGARKTGSQLLITPNCAAALRVLRKSLDGSFKRRDGLKVWVDAICIDQESNAEKSAQVALMSEIYQAAKRVVVWLGEDSAPATAKSLSYMAPCAVLPKIPGLLYFRVFDIFREAVVSFATKMTVKNCGIDAMHRIIVNSYWTRAWTVQEFAHSRVSLLCQDSRLSSFAGLSHIFEPLLMQAIILDPLQTRGLLFHLWIYNVRCFIGSAGNLFVAASNQVDSMINMHASDPRDKIFALRSLSLNALGKVVVDYDRPIEELSTEASRVLMEANQVLSLLYFASRSRTTPGTETMPSWAVDFATKDFLIRGAYDYLGDRWYTASGKSKPKLNFSDDGLTLVIWGKSIGRVGGFISDELSRETRCQEDGMCVCDDSKLQEHATSVRHCSCCSYLEVLERFTVRVAQSVGEGSQLDIKMGSRLYDLLRGTMRLERSNLKVLPPFKRGGGLLDILPILVSNHDTTWAFELLLRSGRMFFTFDGRPGLSVSGIQEGDVISLISGLNLPFAFRRRGEKHVLVGPVLLLGAMHGELWPDKKGQLDVFEIV